MDLFTDSVLRAPTLGCMLMSLAAGIMGCLVFLQKRSLAGEALSHAAYPGVVLSVLIAALFLPFSEGVASGFILVGAFLSGVAGQFAIQYLEKRCQVSSDAALCFVLSTFFGLGVVIASYLQLNQPLWYRQIQLFLFGQAATMTDFHIYLYGGLGLLVIGAVLSHYRFLEISLFDQTFAKTQGLPTKRLELLTHFLLMLVIIMGMRSVGVVLMSAMLIAPAAAARQWTDRLSTFFILSAFFGMLAGFFGNGFSLWIPGWVHQPKLGLPTGPMIVLSATVLCLFSLLFAPKKGYVPRKLRQMRFKWRCQLENVLKDLYKKRTHHGSRRLLWVMSKKGWVHQGTLTPKGAVYAEKLIRLHRLWEVYLVHMGQSAERVHHNAEEMEHLLTPEIEHQLQTLLDHPELDPHSQPIPQQEGR